VSLAPTASQTVGPYLELGLPWPEGPYAVSEATPGAIRIAGLVLDGEARPVPDALVETWQTDPPAGDGFRGFARCPTDDEGRWHVVTLTPDADATGQAPHLAVSVFARGLLHRLVTRIYFADRQGEDAVLAAVPAARRDTLLAQPSDDGYRFDIRLQGPGETVFFDV
jgi:protocatechuate 3,4-dioxygenase, alpha subunit